MGHANSTPQLPVLPTQRYDFPLEKGNPTQNKKHFCIIGGGTSGIYLMKELISLGHQVTCFERLPRVGGVYVKSYKETILTTSSLLTAWSDFSDGKESQPKFWTADEYLSQIDEFTKKYDLLKYIHFMHNVLTVRRENSTGKWHVTVRPGIGCHKVNRCEEIAEDKSAEPFTQEFDGVCVCTGTNTYASLPVFPGQENFKGQIIHSENYFSAEYFRGKRVLVIGSGESGSDITNDISQTASKVAIAIRGLHGHLLPRIQTPGRVTDLNTNRARYSNPYIVGDTIGYVNQAVKAFVGKFAPDSDMKRVLQKIAELNLHQKTSAFSKFGCKNEGFVSAIVCRGAELHRDNFKFAEDRAIFDNGEEFVCDTVVACTGYKNIFPFFDEHHPSLTFAGLNPRVNYKQCMSIEYPGEIAFFGFARPAFGSIPPTVEMQSRLFSLVANGEVILPSKEKMTEIASLDQKNWEARFGYDGKRIKGIVDFQVYCDGIAHAIGVFPPLTEIFFSKPWLWVKIMFGPFTMHQYRFVGPHADPKRAEEVYRRTPIGDLLESSITASFLLTSKVLSLLGFKEFVPNDF